MSGLNKVILIGRVGKSPEVRTLTNGNKVASFSLATSEVYKDKLTGERKEVTEWHNIQAWKGTADIVERYVKKGDMIAIEGKLKTRQWEKDNVTRYVTEVVAESVTMLGSKSSAGSAEVNGNVREPAQATSNGNSTDDLPF